MSRARVPGTEIGEEQIRERLAFIQPYVHWVRSFSCKEGQELIPGIAVENGLKTMVGVWLDEDREQNEVELANAIEIARAGHANILAVGNEVLLRGELSEDELIDYINRAKQAAPGVDVGYVDAYFVFVDHPARNGGLRCDPRQLLSVLGGLPGRTLAAVHERDVSPCGARGERQESHHQ